ncbi:threonine synthase [Rhodoferax ferrireducens]|uniref:threonine synthase n=1 Tax=Rhodoferax ferrireducens TaxID=192843 RepID=UPI000E0CE0A4|nr:pyridoxal-phosphate dependent enzyme [Rhodoferax ferrireducens]
MNQIFSTPRESIAFHPAIQRNPSMVGLRCIGCARSYPVQDLPTGCPHCADLGTPASLEAVYSALPETLQVASSGYKWGAWLPYMDGISLGEGNTPCLDLSRLARELGIRQLTAKHEGMNPTGSHKDRMSAQGISRALDVGAQTVVLASSGNAAVSAAAYCAVAGLRCEVATYRDMPESYARALYRFGAKRFVFEQSFDRWAHVRQRVEREGAFALTNYSVPAVGSPVFGVEAYRAVALECVADGCVPDHVLVPTARGDLLWGLYSGLRDLLAAGLIPHMPRLWAVEPFPRLSRVLAGESLQAEFAGQTAQFSIAGSTVTLQQKLAVERSGGGVVVMNDMDAAQGVSQLAAQGLWVELCAGSCLSALASLCTRGQILPSEHALLLLTAKGDRDTFDVTR